MRTNSLSWTWVLPCEFLRELASVCVCECWRKSKALFPMHLIIPGWGGGWKRVGLPLHQRVFSSHTVVQAHGWPGLPLHMCVYVCVPGGEGEISMPMQHDGCNFFRTFWKYITASYQFSWKLLIVDGNCVTDNDSNTGSFNWKSTFGSKRWRLREHYWEINNLDAFIKSHYDFWLCFKEQILS